MAEIKLRNPPAYETRIIPESELEKWLNEGWEKVDVYIIEEPTYNHAGVSRHHTPIWIKKNKAIIRRAR